MAGTALNLDNPFWQFSCAVYAAPGVRQACLQLQDEHGADVNLLLLAVWLGSARGTRLAKADLADLPGAAWHDQVIRPLRGARRAVATAWESTDPAIAAFRRQLLDCELAAERIRHAALFHWCERRFPVQAGAAGLARANLAMLMGEAAATAAALDLLAAAAEAEAARLG